MRNGYASHHHGDFGYQDDEDNGNSHNNHPFRSPLLSNTTKLSTNNNNKNVNTNKVTLSSPRHRRTTSNNNENDNNNKSKNSHRAETTLEITAAANAGLSLKQEELSSLALLSSSKTMMNNDPMPRRTLFSPSPDEKPKHKNKNSKITSTISTAKTRFR